MTHALIIQVSRDLATMCSYLVFYSRSLFEALDCLHNKYHIVHGDIKPCNTKFYRDTSSSSLVFKLLDFGMSRCVEQSSAVRCDTGTTAFSPPECAARFGGIHPGVFCTHIIYAHVTHFKPMFSHCLKYVSPRYLFCWSFDSCSYDGTRGDFLRGNKGISAVRNDCTVRVRGAFQFRYDLCFIIFCISIFLFFGYFEFGC